jgi:hypothetical protein
LKRSPGATPPEEAWSRKAHPLAKAQENRTFRDGRHSVGRAVVATQMPSNSTVTKTKKGNDHEDERDAEEMQMRIGIGIAVVVAIGLIWSVAVMSEWVPVVSADAALGTRISATPPAVPVWVGPSGDGIMH